MRDRITTTVAVTSGGAADQLVERITDVNCGTVVRFVFAVANFTNAVTAGLKIVDNGNRIVWSTTGLAKSATHSIALDIDVFPGDAVYLTTSGDIGSGPNQCVVARYVRL